MDSASGGSNQDRRAGEDRRSGMDTRSEAERQLNGERRAGADRRTAAKPVQAELQPSSEQLSMFARRLRRALSNERGRDCFGIVRGEYDFVVHPDVLRTIEWIESLVEAETRAAQPGKISLRKARLPVES